MKYKLGDIIKLKSYAEYEYPKYKEQKAKITRILASRGFGYEISWIESDGNNISCVKENNIKLTKLNLRQIYKKILATKIQNE